MDVIESLYVVPILILVADEKELPAALAVINKHEADNSKAKTNDNNFFIFKTSKYYKYPKTGYL